MHPILMHFCILWIFGVKSLFLSPLTLVSSGLAEYLDRPFDLQVRFKRSKKTIFFVLVLQLIRLLKPKTVTLGFMWTLICLLVSLSEPNEKEQLKRSTPEKTEKQGLPTNQDLLTWKEKWTSLLYVWFMKYKIMCRWYKKRIWASQRTVECRCSGDNRKNKAWKTYRRKTLAWSSTGWTCFKRLIQQWRI